MAAELIRHIFLNGPDANSGLTIQLGNNAVFVRVHGAHSTLGASVRCALGRRFNRSDRIAGNSDMSRSPNRQPRYLAAAAGYTRSCRAGPCHQSCSDQLVATLLACAHAARRLSTHAPHEDALLGRSHPSLRRFYYAKVFYLQRSTPLWAWVSPPTSRPLSTTLQSRDEASSQAMFGKRKVRKHNPTCGYGTCFGSPNTQRRRSGSYTSVTPCVLVMIPLTIALAKLVVHNKTDDSATTCSACRTCVPDRSRRTRRRSRWQSRVSIRERTRANALIEWQVYGCALARHLVRRESLVSAHLEGSPAHLAGEVTNAHRVVSLSYRLNDRFNFELIGVFAEAHRYVARAGFVGRSQGVMFAAQSADRVGLGFDYSMRVAAFHVAKDKPDGFVSLALRHIFRMIEL